MAAGEEIEEATTKKKKTKPTKASCIVSLKGTWCITYNPFTLHCWAKILFLMKCSS